MKDSDFSNLTKSIVGGQDWRGDEANSKYDVQLGGCAQRTKEVGQIAE